MIESEAKFSPDEWTQIVEAFEDNLDLLLDMMEAVRCESTNIDDIVAAEFMTGLTQIVLAFRRSHQFGEQRARTGAVKSWMNTRTPSPRMDYVHAFGQVAHDRMD
jgi:hypothetical protein